MNRNGTLEIHRGIKADECQKENLLCILENPEDPLITILITYKERSGEEGRMEVDLTHESNKASARSLLYENAMHFSVDKNEWNGDTLPLKIVE